MAETEEKTADAKSSGFLGKLIAGGIIGAVIMAECCFAYLFIPSAEEVAALAKAEALKEMQSEQDPVDALAPVDEAGPTKEIDLGDFSVTSYQPTSNTTLRVEFHLYGSVLESQTAEFENLHKVVEHRFRDLVLFEVRNSEVTALNDPGLGLIKRRILEKSNELFGKSLLRTVMFSEFSFVEQ